jgi:phytanoyl-CoA hydroxylase
MAVHDAFFARFAKDARFVDFLARLWGPNVALLQSMALMKPPKTGEKRFHQDQAYFRLAPSRVAAYWIAVDDTDAENGCMHVVPGSHKAGVAPHGAKVGLDPSDPEYRRLNLGGVYYSALQPPAATDVVAVPMRAGDAVLFHGDLVHGTPPNASQSRRRFAVQLHYADANCRPTACEDGVPAPNATYGPGGGFDCAPEAGGACVEPQYWFYRQAELIVAGKRVPGCI